MQVSLVTIYIDYLKLLKIIKCYRITNICRAYRTICKSCRKQQMCRQNIQLFRMCTLHNDQGYVLIGCAQLKFFLLCRYIFSDKPCPFGVLYLFRRFSAATYRSWKRRKLNTNYKISLINFSLTIGDHNLSKVDLS